MKKDCLSGIVLVLLAIAVAMGAQAIPESSIGRFGARLVPLIVAGMMAVLGAAIAIDGWRAPAGSSRPDRPVSNQERWPVRLTFALLLAYVILIRSVGFPLTTFFYLVAQMYVLSRFNRTKIPQFVCIALIGTVAIYLVFRTYFHVLLPPGILG